MEDLPWRYKSIRNKNSSNIMALLPGFRKILHSVFIYFLCILINNPFYAQTINNSVNPNEQNFLVRTKQFNEFISRFNYKINFNNVTTLSKSDMRLIISKLVNDNIGEHIWLLNPDYSNYYWSLSSFTTG